MRNILFTSYNSNSDISWSREQGSVQIGWCEGTIRTAWVCYEPQKKKLEHSEILKAVGQEVDQCYGARTIFGPPTVNPSPSSCFRNIAKLYRIFTSFNL